MILFVALGSGLEFGLFEMMGLLLDVKMPVFMSNFGITHSRSKLRLKWSKSECLLFEDGFPEFIKSKTPYVRVLFINILFQNKKNRTKIFLHSALRIMSTSGPMYL